MRVRDFSFAELGIIDGLLHGAPRIEGVGREAPKYFASDLITAWIGPVFGICAVDVESLYGGGNFDRGLVVLKRRKERHAVAERTQTLGDSGGIVIYVGDESKTSDENAGHT